MLMDEKKFVTLEMFEKYHENLMNYIGMHDDLMLDGETTCPKCGSTHVSLWDRIIGYLTKVKNWAEPRRIEQKTR